MKNSKLLLVVLLMIGLASCKKKDPAIEAKAAIVGKWTLKSILEINYKNGVKQNENISYEEKIDLEIKDNGKAIFDKSEYNYQLEGDKRLKLIYPEESRVQYDFEIKKITGNELNLYLEEIDTAKNGDIRKQTYDLNFTK
ncbi:lipocalin-like domain-containing protein [Pedobacter caeni]|uniref:Lipocalin-like domain-containing protein n=1 Tax=Pedobacter caeni TaxID=288992 RepID=A0A1M4W882_9SPHI|nr:lipocalin family protein [Pedobacter caeni]SHE77355.1 Lipocalin-like domain-containing protein [Pedobacter caeni]